MSAAAPPPSTLDLATDRVAEGGRATAPVALGHCGSRRRGDGARRRRPGPRRRGPLAAVAGSGPDVLHIGSGFSGGGAADVVTDAKGLRAGRYVLTGTLPGSPDRGTAWWLTKGSVDAAQVARARHRSRDVRRAAAGRPRLGRPRRSAMLRVYDQPGLPFAFDASPDDGLCPSMPTDGFGGPDSASAA